MKGHPSVKNKQDNHGWKASRKEKEGVASKKHNVIKRVWAAVGSQCSMLFARRRRQFSNAGLALVQPEGRKLHAGSFLPVLSVILVAKIE